MTIQLNPPLPFWTPKGFAHAHVMIDPGIDHDLQWVCFIVATGECWTYLNKDIRLVDNETMGRKLATVSVRPTPEYRTHEEKVEDQANQRPDFACAHPNRSPARRQTNDKKSWTECFYCQDCKDYFTCQEVEVVPVGPKQGPLAGAYSAEELPTPKR